MILKNTYIRIKDRKEPRTHFFTVVFPAINHWFEETVVESGDENSIIYILFSVFKKGNLKKIDEKHKWPFGYNFQILYLVVKNEWPLG